MKDDEITCQCPTYGVTGVNRSWYEDEELKAIGHPEGACPGDYDLQLYSRKGEELWLCSCCCLWGDIQISRTSAVRA